MSDTARTRAIDAMTGVFSVQGTRRDICGQLLDAVLDQVLADLLIERGALVPVVWVSDDGLHNVATKRTEGHSHYSLQGVRIDRLDDYNTTPLYRLTPKESS
jgi:hypothetical protein